MGVASRAPKMYTYRGTKPKTEKYFFSVQFITRGDIAVARGWESTLLMQGTWLHSWSGN